MIDDSDAEINAIQATFPNIQIFICLWHVTRAWNKNIKSKVSFIINILYNKIYILILY